MKILGLEITLSPKPKPAQSHGVLVSRGHDAARTDRLYNDWNPDYGYTASEAANQWLRVVQRSRDMAKNNPYAKKWVWMMRSNIVGDLGFVLSSRAADLVTDPKTRNRVPVLDDAANNEIEREFRKWGKNPYWADMSTRKSWLGIQLLAVTNLFRDGEAIIQIVDGADKHGNPYSFSLKVHQPESLDISLNIEKTKVGTKIINGVEVDSWGEPIKYWFRKRSTTLLATDPYASHNTGHVSIPARNIVHLMIPEDEQQYRGWPMLSCTLDRLKMLDGYDEAELEAARDAANSLGVYSRDPNTVTDPSQIASAESVRGSIQDREPGAREIMPPGWTYDESNPMRPNQAYSAFHQEGLRGIATGGLASYNALAEDWVSVSWSSLREAKLSTTDLYKLIQNIVASQLCDRVFLRWLKMYLSFGKTNLPLSKEEKFAMHSWFAKRWKWVNPAQEANANKIARDNGWTTDNQIAAEQGSDYTENVDMIKATAPKVAGTYLEENYASTEAE